MFTSSVWSFRETTNSPTPLAPYYRPLFMTLFMANYLLFGTSGWEYDAAGNQTRTMRADGTWQRYVYDAAGRIVKIQNDAGITQVIHTHGASNHRLIEQVGNESSNQRDRHRTDR